MVAAAERPTPSIAGWWHDHRNLDSLYEWMCRSGRLEPDDVEAVAYFLRKPWKWSVEYREMVSEAIEP